MFATNLKHRLAGIVDLMVDAATLGEYGFEQAGEQIAGSSCSPGAEGRRHHARPSHHASDRAHERIAA